MSIYGSVIIIISLDNTEKNNYCINATYFSHSRNLTFIPILALLIAGATQIGFRLVQKTFFLLTYINLNSFKPTEQRSLNKGSERFKNLEKSWAFIASYNISSR